MKTSSKRILSSVCAGVMTLALAVSASANDYVRVPENAHGAPAIAGGAATSTAAVSTVQVKSIKTGESIDVEASFAKLRIKASVLSKLAKADGSALNLVGEKATLTILGGESIKSTKSLNLASRVINADNFSKIIFKNTEDFGCSVRVAFTKCKMSAEALEKASVYCNGEKTEIELQFDENGVPFIEITKGGTYTIK